MILVFRMHQYALLKVGYLMPPKVRMINSFIMPSEILPYHFRGRTMFLLSALNCENGDFLILMSDILLSAL
jgi:hypothetical protein